MADAQVKCWWVFHDWEPWSDPYPLKTQYVDDRGQPLGEPRVRGWEQSRNCRLCHKHVVRNIR